MRMECCFWNADFRKKKQILNFCLSNMESLFSILQIDIRFNNLPGATYSIGLVYVGIYIPEVSIASFKSDHSILFLNIFSCLYKTSEVYDIPEVYMNFMRTKQLPIIYILFAKQWANKIKKTYVMLTRHDIF